MGCLDNKVAIVTGAGGGIGRAYALLFAREGARVVVNDVGSARDGMGGDGSNSAGHTVAEIEKSGGRAVANTEAVGSFESAEGIVQSALDAFGQLDILVNNAGILRDRTILKMTPDEWNLVLRVHLKGTFACLQAAARAMKMRGEGGRIINTSSSSGLLGNFGQANYGAAKAGIHALTRIAAQELARHRITVNAIAPIALTRMTEDLPGRKKSMTVQAMGPQHIAPLAAFLASDDAAAITGQTFGVEGNHVFVYRMMTSHGVTNRRSDEPWTVEEIGKAIERIVEW
jgi:NAD(P)-dependent dehydrogenase (short-subunit alcohol dehydrogenase family)